MIGAVAKSMSILLCGIVSEYEPEVTFYTVVVKHRLSFKNM